MKPYQLPQRIIDLANEYDESKHPRDENGQWTSTGGGTPSGYKRDDKQTSAGYKNGALTKLYSGDRASQSEWVNQRLRQNRAGKVDPGESRGGKELHHQRIRGLHIAAIAAGLRYNRSTHQYE